jgi:hypothetical protein
VASVLRYARLNSTLLSGRRREVDPHTRLHLHARIHHRCSSLQASGAYVFRPSANETVSPVSPTGARLTLVTGPLVAEAWQDFGAWASQVVRLSAGSLDVELQWTMGPVPVDKCVR